MPSVYSGRRRRIFSNRHALLRTSASATRSSERSTGPLRTDGIDRDAERPTSRLIPATEDDSRQDTDRPGGLPRKAFDDSSILTEPTAGTDRRTDGSIPHGQDGSIPHEQDGRTNVSGQRRSSIWDDLRRSVMRRRPSRKSGTKQDSSYSCSSETTTRDKKRSVRALGNRAFRSSNRTRDSYASTGSNGKERRLVSVVLDEYRSINRQSDDYYVQIDTRRGNRLKHPSSSSQSQSQSKSASSPTAPLPPPPVLATNANPTSAPPTRTLDSPPSSPLAASIPTRTSWGDYSTMEMRRNFLQNVQDRNEIIVNDQYGHIFHAVTTSPSHDIRRQNRQDNDAAALVAAIISADVDSEDDNDENSVSADFPNTSFIGGYISPGPHGTSEYNSDEAPPINPDTDSVASSPLHSPPTSRSRSHIRSPSPVKRRLRFDRNGSPSPSKINNPNDVNDNVVLLESPTKSKRSVMNSPSFAHSMHLCRHQRSDSFDALEQLEPPINLWGDVLRDDNNMPSSGDAPPLPNDGTVETSSFQQLLGDCIFLNDSDEDNDGNDIADDGNGSNTGLERVPNTSITPKPDSPNVKQSGDRSKTHLQSATTAGVVVESEISKDPTDAIADTAVTTDTVTVVQTGSSPEGVFVSDGTASTANSERDESKSESEKPTAIASETGSMEAETDAVQSSPPAATEVQASVPDVTTDITANETKKPDDSGATASEADIVSASASPARSEQDLLTATGTVIPASRNEHDTSIEVPVHVEQKVFESATAAAEPADETIRIQDKPNHDADEECKTDERAIDVDAFLRNRTVRFADEAGLPMSQIFVIGGPDDANALSRTVIVLLSPENRQFEFIQAEYRTNSSTTVSDLVEQLPGMATNPLFHSQKFMGVCRTMETGIELLNTKMLRDCGLCKNEILVAINEGHTAKKMMQCAMPLLINERISKAVKYARRSGRGLKYIMSAEEMEQERLEKEITGPADPGQEAGHSDEGKEHISMLHIDEKKEDDGTDDGMRAYDDDDDDPGTDDDNFADAVQADVSYASGSKSSMDMGMREEQYQQWKSKHKSSRRKKRNAGEPKMDPLSEYILNDETGEKIVKVLQTGLMATFGVLVSLSMGRSAKKLEAEGSST